MMLTPIDVVVFVALLLRANLGVQVTQNSLAQALDVSQPTIHRSLKQLDLSGLIRAGEPQRATFRQLVIHAVGAVYPAKLGPPARGIPTAHSAPMFAELLTSEQSYVWGFDGGTVMGTSLEPLHACVPAAAARDDRFYECMALIDVFRVGRARDRRIAEQRLVETLRVQR